MRARKAGPFELRMYKKMIMAGLAARPVRTTVSILAVTLEVTLILVVVGLTAGISDETAKRTEGVGADILFQPPNSSLLLALSNSTMPVALGDKIREIDGVKAVVPVQTQVNSTSGLEVIYGIDFDKFNEVTGGFIWHKGGRFSAPDEVIVDDIYALAKHVNVGDHVELLNHKFKVAGIVEHGKGARLFIPLLTAQGMTGGVNRASLFYVKLKDPDQVHTVIDGARRIHRNSGFCCRLYRCPGDFSFNVHHHHGADAGDRHSALSGRLEAVHRGSYFSRVGGCLFNRDCDGNRRELPYGKAGDPRVPNSYRANHHRLDR